MDLVSEFEKVIYNWVKKNFGESEADDPSWSIEELSKVLAREYWGIRERHEFENIKEDVQSVADDHDIKLTDEQLNAIADDYRYSESYCSKDSESIYYFIKHELEK